MGIQLDWQIESERQQKHAVEDPNNRRQRRRQWRSFFLTILLVTCVVAGAAAAIIWRLNTVDNQLRQNLLDTVDAEVRAIKVGDEADYLAIRRSESPYWNAKQSEIFAEYQRLKTSGELELTGEVLDVEIDFDESRARVLVEEIVADTPYQVAWFYWYYADEEQGGWRRVPPDSSFWGEADSITTGNTIVRYSELDEPLAQAIAERVGAWYTIGCELLTCATELPDLTIKLEPRSAAPPEWDRSNEWQILVPSPYYESRVNQNQPMTPDLATQLAAMIAERIVNHNVEATASLDASFVSVQTNAYIDAQWLRDEYIAWLFGRFTNQGQQTFLETIITLYGESSPSLLARVLQVDTQLGPMLETAVGIPIANMDTETLNAIYWEDYFAFRLTFENRLLRDEFGLNDQQQLIIRHNTMYDELDSTALAIADTNRRAFNATQPDATVISVDISKDDVGRPTALVNAVFFEGQPPTTIIFRWDGFTWKRIG